MTKMSASSIREKRMEGDLFQGRGKKPGPAQENTGPGQRRGKRMGSCLNTHYFFWRYSSTLKPLSSYFFSFRQRETRSIPMILAALVLLPSTFFKTDMM